MQAHKGLGEHVLEQSVDQKGRGQGTLHTKATQLECNGCAW